MKRSPGCGFVCREFRGRMRMREKTGTRDEKERGMHFLPARTERLHDFQLFSFFSLFRSCLSLATVCSVPIQFISRREHFPLLLLLLLIKGMQ